MEVIIHYNTVSFEFKVECNDSIIKNNLEQIKKDNQGKRITDWVKEFIKKIKEETNNDPFTIKIIGCDLYEMDFINELISEKNDIISIEFEQVFDDKEIQYKYKVIDDFLEYVEQSKYDIVKNALLPNIKNIKNLRSTKIEVPVIATMSSGKSTLLNALIGQDFLHEDTGATTATTCDIIVNNNLKDFYAKAILNDNEEHNSNKEISEFLKRWNANANENIDNTNNVKKYPDLKLEIEGPISNLNTSNFNLNFIDTPGPNSSQHSHHKEKTFSYLKDNQNLPIVLYVLDPEKMDSNDDDFTLEEISKVFKNNNKNIDRVVFVYNKIDREDIEEKSIKDILNKVESFLERKGIKNAKIFPVSAQYAKFAQIEECLKRNQKSDLNSFRSKFRPEPGEGYLGYQLLEYAPLTNSQKEKLNENLKKNQVEEDLVYSGLAALKLYIEDYIINHHKKNQYKELRNIVNKVSEQIKTTIQLEEERLEEITEGEKKEREDNQKKQIEQLQKKREEAFEEIYKIKVDNKFIDEASKEVNKKLNELKNKILQRNELSKAKTIPLIKQVNAAIENLQISIKTDLISTMNNKLNEYLSKFKQITNDKFSLNTNDIEIDAFNAEMGNNINGIDIDHLQKYQQVKEETKVREVESRWWIKQFFNWTVTEEYKVTKVVINTNELYKDAIDPYSKKFTKVLEDYKQNFIEIFADVRESFTNRIENNFENIKNNIYKDYTSLVSIDKKNKEKELKKLHNISNDISKFKIN